MSKHKLKPKTDMANYRQRARSIVTDGLWAAKNVPHIICMRWQASRQAGWRYWLMGSRKLKVGGALVLMAALIVSPIFMGRSAALTAGPNGPTAATTPSGTAWTSPANVYAQDSVYASYLVGAGLTSSALNITGFGFNIPTGSTINGITATVWRYSPSVKNSAIQDSNVQLLLANVASGTNQAVTGTTWPTSNTSTTYGSSSSLWGATVAAADVNNTGFGLTITAKNVKSGGGASNTAYIDYASLTITYTPPPYSFNQASYRLFNNQDASSGGGTLNFATKVDYTTGMYPYGVALADVNGDTKQDIVSANEGGSTASVLLGNGDGTFGAKTDYTTGSNPIDVVTVDVNADGKPDIMTSNSANTVSVLLNNGNGTFGAKTDYTTGAGPYSVALSDLNGDNKIDITVADNTTNSVSVLLGNGNGTFGAKTDYTTGAGPYSVALADLNGDAIPDIAVSNNSANTVSVLLNNGNGTFGTKTDYTTGPNPWHIVLADMTGDSKLDMVVADDGASTVSVLIGNGNGTFGTKTDYTIGGSPVGVAVADLNADSQADIVSANPTPSTVSVLLNSSPPSINVGTPLASQNTAATLSGDGQPFRLRMDVGVSGSDLAANGQSFKLQYAPMTTSCDASFTNTTSSTYADVTDTSTVKYYDNSTATNSTTVATNTNDPSDGTNTTSNGGVIPETYQEKGTTTFTNPTAIPAGKDGMWDFALTTSKTLGSQHYCMRIVKSDGTALNTYTVIPEIIMPATTYNQAAYRIFNSSSNSSAKTFVVGLGGSQSDMAESVVKTSDGGYIATGSTGSYDISGNAGSSNMFLAKYDSSGTLTWFRTWGGTGSETGYAVIQTSDGGYAVTGTTTSFGGDPTWGDSFIAKFDSTGTLSWARTWGGSGMDFSWSLVQTSDGGYAITGTYSGSNDDAFIAKYDSSGTLLWYHLWGNTSSSTPDEGNCIIQTSDGGFAVTGQTKSYGDTTNGDMFLAKYDSSGTLSWSRTWGGTGSDGGNSIIQTSDGGFAITGNTKSYGDTTNGDMFLAKYDSSGTLSWSRTWGGTDVEQAHKLIQTPDGGYAIAGQTRSYGNGLYDVFLAKYDNNGNIAGCSSPMCLSPTATTTSPTATTTSPTAAINAPTLTTTSPTDASVSRTPAVYYIVALAGGIDIGSPLAAQNTSLTFNSVGTPFRLRIALGVLNSGVGASGQSFKLQYANKTSSCSASTYADITTGTPVAWYDNASSTGGDSIVVNANDPTDGTNTNVAETYQESNPFTNSAAVIYAGQDGLWDFSLIVPDGTRPGLDICLRVVKNDGTVLDTYSVYPELQFGPRMPQLMRQGKWFNSSGVLQNYFLTKY